jgi:PIN domain nuclease of toxin-antitoxin system
MRYLLDTHTFAWIVGDPSKLSQTVRDLANDPSNQLVISPVALWEMSIKYHKGKWPEAAPFLEHSQYLMFLDMLAAIELAINSEHTRLAGSFSMSHQDPFDRLLVAQAAHNNLPLLSKDTQLDAFPITRIWHSL